MKKLIKVVRNSTCALLLGFFALFGAAEMVAMEAVPQLRQRIAAELERQAAQKRGWYVYGVEGEENKILVDENILKLSTTLKNMMEDIDYDAKEALPLNAPVSTIKLGFDILRLYNPNQSEQSAIFNTKIEALTFDQLASMLTFFDYLEVPEQLRNLFLTRMRKQVAQNSNVVATQEFTSLNPDLQKLLMVEPTIKCLKNEIIKKYTQARKINFSGDLRSIRGVLLVAFSPDGTKIVSGSFGGQNNLTVWDAKSGTQLFNLAGNPEVNSVAFSSDGTKIVSGSGGGQNNLMVWDASTGTQLLNLVGHPEEVLSVASSPDGTKIVSGSNGVQNNLMVWDADTGTQLLNLVGHPEGVRSVAFSPDGEKIVSGGFGDQNNLMVWDANTGAKLFDLVGHPEGVRSVAFSPDGKKIVSGGFGDQNNLMVWDTDTGTQLLNLAGHPENVFSAAFSPNGTKIVSGALSKQNSLMVWDANIGTQLLNLVGHPEGVNLVAFSPDGTKIVSVGSGNRNYLMVWDANTGTQLLNLVGHPEGVRSAAFSPDGKKIVSGGYGNQNNLIMWTLLTNQEEAVLKNINSCTADQVRLIFQLCSELYKSSVSLLTDDRKLVFDSLSDEMKKLLNDIFWSK